MRHLTLAENAVLSKQHGPVPTEDIASVLDLRSGTRGSVFARLRAAGLWAGGVLAVMAAAYYFWSGNGGTSAIRYVTEPLRIGALTVVVSATGSLQPTRVVDISSELSGTVRAVHVDYNSVVKVGQPLAELDTDKLRATAESSRAKRDAARARAKEAEATVIETRIAYERKNALAQRQVTSGQDLDAAKAAYDRATASLASARADAVAAEADLRLQETNLAKACICSPIDGIVLKRNVDPGQTVASSFQAPVLFTIAEDLKEMEVQVDVDEADVGKVATGQDATFTVDAYPDRKFKARITSLYFGSEIVQGVVTYKAVLSTENPDLLLRPGMTATAEITVQKIDQALMIPNAALRFSPPAVESPSSNDGFLRRIIPGMPRFRPASRPEQTGTDRTVWILRDGTPTPVAVAVGATDGRWTQVTAGSIDVNQPAIVDTASGARR